MATDSEIYRAASLLIQEFGEMATIGAQVKADQMQDRAARSVWLRVARATQELLSESAPGRGALN
ncbi:MAG: hypothetical protein COW30_05455 [Rhodospirillales bacterium CG15_BIG_FIL_POST_REV_8_21_14_020_66_15]|nr:MAG: hypothetical protein COW30_05455 [Rhodospirillales bacterium CG15_BIG_FIL_POST_REV_8_21_14_020_66_15]